VSSVDSGGAPKGERDLRELVVNLVSEAGGVDDGERDANALLLELCKATGQRSVQVPALTQHAPTLIGLILMPSSW
jgi:hypothetical protein